MIPQTELECVPLNLTLRSGSLAASRPIAAGVNLSTSAILAGYRGHRAKGTKCRGWRRDPAYDQSTPRTAGKILVVNDAGICESVAKVLTREAYSVRALPQHSHPWPAADPLLPQETTS